MKILWITNILFPEAQQKLNGNGELRASGGWMLGAAQALLQRDTDVKLTVAAPSSMVKELTYLKGEQMDYYILPWKTKNYDEYWKKVKDKVCPDIVHIHGTEFSHGLAYVKACGAEHVVVSIQGLVSVIADYYLHGMSICDVICNITIRDLLRRDTLFLRRRDFRRRGQNEEELIKSVGHIIGRTSWDKAHVWAINPNATYHFCNETLRKEFYTGGWSYDKCTPHTIFMSQAKSPIKGVQQVLKAMPIILKHYPDTQLRIAGQSVIGRYSLFQRIKRTGYGKYIEKLIEEYNLSHRIVFLGPLNANEIRREYLMANVFLCPSSIENSPNSLSEAQILGTPCIASYVGGVPDMMQEDEDYLYRFEDTKMLAWKICRLFETSAQFDNTKMREKALQRCNPKENAKRLMHIYHEIMNCLKVNC